MCRGGLRKRSAQSRIGRGPAKSKVLPRLFILKARKRRSEKGLGPKKSVSAASLPRETVTEKGNTKKKRRSYRGDASDRSARIETELHYNSFSREKMSTDEKGVRKKPKYDQALLDLSSLLEGGLAEGEGISVSILLIRINQTSGREGGFPYNAKERSGGLHLLKSVLVGKARKESRRKA